MKTKIVRFYKEGWHHATLIKQGRKWAIVCDLHESTRIKDGAVVREKRKRKVPVSDIEDGLWQ